MRHILPLELFLLPRALSLFLCLGEEHLPSTFLVFLLSLLQGLSPPAPGFAGRVLSCSFAPCFILLAGPPPTCCSAPSPYLWTIILCLSPHTYSSCLRSTSYLKSHSHPNPSLSLFLLFSIPVNGTARNPQVTQIPSLAPPKVDISAFLK